MSKADWAAELARKLLEVPLPRRWAHVQGVAAQARSLAPILGDDADLLEAAAWLHDIGYSPELADTGFHPLDGARYLRDVEHADPALCSWSRTTRARSSKPKNAAWPTPCRASSLRPTASSTTPWPTAT